MRITICRCSGSIRFIFFLLGLIAFLLWSGGQGVYTAVKNRKPITMSFSEFEKAKPEAKWLALTGCTLDLTDAAYRTIKGSQRPIELYVPVYPNDSKEGKIQVLLATKSPDLIQTVMEVNALESRADAKAYDEKNHDRLFPKRDIKGLVRYGIELNDNDRRKIAGLLENAAKNFIIVDDTKSPELSKSLGLLLGGFAFLAGGIMYVRRNKEDSSADI
jgi:hypothetical protein